MSVIDKIQIGNTVYDLVGSSNENQNANENAVLYTEQELTNEQQIQARNNIGAGTFSLPINGIPAEYLASNAQRRPHSTNIDEDGNNNEKTVSPKAVKDFVEGKNYFGPDSLITSQNIDTSFVPNACHDVVEDNTNDDSYATPRAVYDAILELAGGNYIVAWDGNSAPVEANIPLNVAIIYNGNPYTGSLQPNASTKSNMYLVSDGSTNFGRYVTTYNNGNYAWTYLGTTTIDISTKANITDTPKFYNCLDIENLGGGVLDDLRPGDIVIKQTGNEKHTYYVSYKSVVDANTTELSLVYNDHHTREEVYYEKREGTWTFVVKDVAQESFLLRTEQPVNGFKPNIHYNLGIIENDVEFNLDESFDDIDCTYYLTFTIGKKLPSITWPANIKWPRVVQREIYTTNSSSSTSSFTGSTRTLPTSIANRFYNNRDSSEEMVTVTVVSGDPPELFPYDEVEIKIHNNHVEYSIFHCDAENGEFTLINGLTIDEDGIIEPTSTECLKITPGFKPKDRYVTSIVSGHRTKIGSDSWEIRFKLKYTSASNGSEDGYSVITTTAQDSIRINVTNDGFVIFKISTNGESYDVNRNSSGYFYNNLISPKSEEVVYDIEDPEHPGDPQYYQGQVVTLQSTWDHENDWGTFALEYDGKGHYRAKYYDESTENWIITSVSGKIGTNHYSNVYVPSGDSLQFNFHSSSDVSGLQFDMKEAAIFMNGQLWWKPSI